MKCWNCNCTESSSTTYASGEGVRLPALLCAGCGCLELDESKMDEILRALRVPELRNLRGAQLRDTIWRLLTGAMIAPSAQRPGSSASPTRRDMPTRVMAPREREMKASRGI